MTGPSSRPTWLLLAAVVGGALALQHTKRQAQQQTTPPATKQQAPPADADKLDRPVSELGVPALDELFQQAISLASFKPLSKDVLGTQSAFNVYRLTTRLPSLRLRRRYDRSLVPAVAAYGRVRRWSSGRYRRLTRNWVLSSSRTSYSPSSLMIKPATRFRFTIVDL